MIGVECSACGAKGQVDESKRPAGATTIRCPKCGASIPLPPPEEDAWFDPAPAAASVPVPPSPPHPGVAEEPPLTLLRPAQPTSGAEEELPLSLRRPTPQNDRQEGGTPCTLCGRSFPLADLARFGSEMVCADCKPGYVQLLRQGAPVSEERRYGGFWIRVAAKLLDGIILWIINMAISLAGLGAMFTQTGNPRMAVATIGLQWIVQISVSAAYVAYFLGAHAATPGKMALKLEVLRADGERLTYLRALGRHFAEMLSSIILCIGYIMAAFDDEKRALHDRICDTRVVYK